MTHPDIDGFLASDAPKRRRAGRPVGSKNKTEETVATEQGLKRMYDRLRPHITATQREYLEEVMGGKRGVDTLHELELMVRQLGFVFSEASDKAWKTKTVTKEFTELVNAFRMLLTDLEKVRVAKEDVKRKQGRDDVLEVDEAFEEKEFMDSIINSAKGKAP